MRASVLALFLAGCSTAQGAQTEAPARYAVTAVGRIEAAGEARYLVAQTDGIISKLHVARGEAVSIGQTLLEVSCDPDREQVAARAADAVRSTASAATVAAGARPEEIEGARAAETAVAARLGDAIDARNRAEALREAGFVTRRELDLRANAVLSSRADLQGARARLALLQNGARSTDILAARAAAQAAAAETRIAQARLARCRLVSPIAGRVLQILHRPGEYSGASQGLPLIIVGDTSSLVVRAEINERDVAAVRPGLPVEVWIDGSDTKYRGQVSEGAGVMGRRNTRSLDPTDRFDRDVREVFVTFDKATPPALVGLRVNVGLLR